ncbi:hypothetical protein E2C01_077301 [Portunus trituberculatus]|uniref:Uncharacterized protein n=1 Tax=Portunus trituberculatus TaxID=210409 RepID=A0A5B7ILW9_PORTR|nr:hypothetical protein [Portunus trituberculatus]
MGSCEGYKIPLSFPFLQCLGCLRTWAPTRQTLSEAEL